MVFGEAKWNSPLGSGQGVAGNRTQLDLRLAFCTKLGLGCLPMVRHWAILGVGREKDVLSASPSRQVTIQNISWAELIEFLPSALRPELNRYVAWKGQHSSR